MLTCGMGCYACPAVELKRSWWRGVLIIYRVWGKVKKGWFPHGWIIPRERGMHLHGSRRPLK